jgi:hypothetical protein
VTGEIKNRRNNSWKTRAAAGGSAVPVVILIAWFDDRYQLNLGSEGIAATASIVTTTMLCFGDTAERLVASFISKRSKT